MMSLNHFNPSDWKHIVKHGTYSLNITKPGVFDIHELDIVAADDVAFAFGSMQCSDKTDREDYFPLDFRITIGLKKIKGQWMILHEHHSIPAAQGN